MAFIYCDSCGFQQDDFWHSGYNPLRYLQEWITYILDIDLEKQFSDCSEFVAQNGPITIREVVARECEKAARNIREIKWRTFEEFEKDPEKKCPKCGASGRENWNID